MRIADSTGRLAVIAADHGDPLVEMLEAAGLSAGAEAQRAIKYDIVDTVGRDASAVLLDPDVSVTEIVERGALARDVGLLVRIEADGFDTVGGLRRSRLIDGLGAAGAARAGRTPPRSWSSSGRIVRALRATPPSWSGTPALEDCHREHLLCVIEAMTYRLEDESPAVFAARRGKLIPDSAVLLEACGANCSSWSTPARSPRARRCPRRSRPHGRSSCRRGSRRVLRAAQGVRPGRRRGLHRRAVPLEGVRADGS